MQIAVVCITGFFKKIMWQDFCWSIDLTPDFCVEVVLRLWDLALKRQSTGQPLELSRWLLLYWWHTFLAQFCCFWKRKGQQWLFSFLSGSPLTVFFFLLLFWKLVSKRESERHITSLSPQVRGQGSECKHHAQVVINTMISKFSEWKKSPCFICRCFTTDLRLIDMHDS